MPDTWKYLLGVTAAGIGITAAIYWSSANEEEEISRSSVELLREAKRLEQQGYLEQAEEKYQNLIELLRQPEDNIKATYQLAAFYRRQGRTRDYGKQLRKVKQLMEKGGKDKVIGFDAYIDVLSALSTTHMEAIEYTQSEELLLKALKLIEGVPSTPPRSELQAVLRGKLAHCFMMQGRLDEANETYEMALEEQKKAFGETSKIVATTKEIMKSLSLNSNPT
ncbi:hypothetical protein PROFUN_11040 [Planoprotostelium fungivorum]|uniref:Tetratricopeptide repeat protein n=1 Tax=Planoprotostelium fungivorum TaxID=1890364 RepID=A0A2P6NBP1_9EUKA|nr:hypothetical protein PROFUN_11040 [Planoprotostelium fungivorum]